MGELTLEFKNLGREARRREVEEDRRQGQGELGRDAVGFRECVQRHCQPLFQDVIFIVSPFFRIVSSL